MVSGEGSSEVTPTAIAKRRARNRVSQRSFRERQARYVKELESKVAQKTQHEGIRLKSAELECQRLRETLLSTKNRILGLRSALSGIADNIDSSLEVLSEIPEVDPPANSQSECLDRGYQNQTDQFQVHSSDNVEDSATRFDHAETTEELAEPPVHESQNTDPIIASQHISNNEPQLCLDEHANVPQVERQHNDVVTDNSSFSVAALFEPVHVAQPQPSSYPYQNYNGQRPNRWPLIANHAESTRLHLPLLSSSSPVEDMNFLQMNIGFPPGVANFPSVFSAHLAVCEYFTKQNHAYKDRLQSKGMESFAKLISTMVNMFVNTCWPDMRIWWAYIQSSTVVEKIVRWNLDPCLETYKSLPITHRPTALQLCTAHPLIIDWAFFPSIRDRMIEIYSHSWMLDELVCELLHAYVVEADLTKLVTGMDNLPPQKGYFRIWDIVQTISREDLQSPQNARQQNADLWGNEIQLDEDLFAEPTSPFEIEQAGNNEIWVKMPLDQIYQSRKASLKLFRLLRMEDRRTVKVDPIFAAAHPELCDDVSIVASGIDCTLRGNNVQVPRPKPLTREAIINYKMMLWKANM